MEERRLKFNEAVQLYRDRFQLGGGEAHALAWRAIESREVECAWTEAAIVAIDTRAHRELCQSMQREAAARGLKVNNDLLRQRARQGAYEQTRQRLLLLTEVTSAAFKDEVIAGNIVLSETDLLSWCERQNELPQKNKIKHSPAGRPPAHDWAAFKEKFLELLDAKGDFRRPENQVDGWNSQASAARTLLKYISKGNDKPPDAKTIEGYIGDWIKTGGA
jgi:hypothetical protein